MRAAEGELKVSASSVVVGTAIGVDEGWEEVLILWEWLAGVLPAGDLPAAGRAGAPASPARGEPWIFWGVPAGLFFGVEAALEREGVAIGSRHSVKDTTSESSSRKFGSDCQVTYSLSVSKKQLISDETNVVRV